MSLFLYLAGCLHDAIDDLHRLNPIVTGSAADMFDRFLGWPARHTHAYRVTIFRRRADRGAVTVNGIGLIAEFVTALNTCADHCAFLRLLPWGAQAGNRYFEHSTFTARETAPPRPTRHIGVVTARRRRPRPEVDLLVTELGAVAGARQWTGPVHR